MKTRQPPATPEHEKLKEVAEFSQKIGEFLDWLQDEKNVLLARNEAWEEQDVLAELCAILDHTIPRREALKDRMKTVQGLLAIRERKEDLLAEFFGIDLKKIEQEKRALLAYCRAANP